MQQSAQYLQYSSILLCINLNIIKRKSGHVMLTVFESVKAMSYSSADIINENDRYLWKCFLFQTENLSLLYLELTLNQLYHQVFMLHILCNFY